MNTFKSLIKTLPRRHRACASQARSETRKKSCSREAVLGVEELEARCVPSALVVHSQWAVGNDNASYNGDELTAANTTTAAATSWTLGNDLIFYGNGTLTAVNTARLREQVFALGSWSKEWTLGNDLVSYGNGTITISLSWIRREIWK